MRRVVRLMVVIAALTILVNCKGEKSSLSPGPGDVICRAEDGVETRGILYPVDAPRPPGVVLVHAFGSSPESWAPIARRAQERGLMCFAMGMRSIDVSSKGTAMDVLKDIDAAMDVLRERGADPENLAIAGASLGANLALHYAAAHVDVQATVLISPGLELKGIETEPAVIALGKRPLLLVTSKGDAYSASSCTKLKSVAPGFCELREYEGSAHGTDIFTASPNSIEQILLWLEGIVGGKEPATPGKPA